MHRKKHTFQGAVSAEEEVWKSFRFEGEFHSETGPIRNSSNCLMIRGSLARWTPKYLKEWIPQTDGIFLGIKYIKDLKPIWIGVQLHYLKAFAFSDSCHNFEMKCLSLYHAVSIFVLSVFNHNAPPKTFSNDSILNWFIGAPCLAFLLTL